MVVFSKGQINRIFKRRVSKCKEVDSFKLSQPKRMLQAVVLNPGYISSKKYKRLKTKLRKFVKIGQKFSTKKLWKKRQNVFRNLRKYSTFFFNFKGGNYIFTKKSKNSRMGKGKGSYKHWLLRVERGDILFKLTGVKEIPARSIYNEKLYIKFRVKFYISFYNYKYNRGGAGKPNNFMLLNYFRYR